MDSILFFVMALLPALVSADTIEEQLESILKKWPRCQEEETRYSCSKNESVAECIEMNQFCDNHPQCTNRVDESYLLCSKLKCPKEMFRCSYGSCVLKDVVCNNITDCFDGSDENHKSCRQLLNRNHTSTCAKNEFMCHSGDQCVKNTQLCDGKRQCEDMSDESVVECQDKKCDHLRCSSGGCVKNGLICDHYHDCHDESDEGETPDHCHIFHQSTDCTMSTEEVTEDKLAVPMFKCGSGECIFLYKQCNNVTDCDDGSDEPTGNKCARFRPCTKYKDDDEVNTIEEEEDSCSKVDNVFEEDQGDKGSRTGCRLIRKCYDKSGNMYNEFEEYYCYNGDWFRVTNETCIEPRGVGAGIIAAITIVAALLVVFAVLIIMYLMTIKKERQMRDEILGMHKKGLIKLDKTKPLDEQADDLAYDKKWEFPKVLLTIGSQLGSGAFGVVMKADALGIVRGEEQTTVAVKMVKSDATQPMVKALATELKILIHLGKHINIVNLLGACTKNVIKNELYVILEYCPRGNLHDYLINIRGKFQSDLGQVSETEYYNTVQQQTDGDHGWSYNMQGEEKVTTEESERVDGKTLLVWAFQIARGMEYLSGRRIIHGDLATRNILLAHENLVKISDFGLARSLYSNPEYHKKSDAPVPLKWLAIESVQDCIFSTQSDVWAFGITLWEIFSLGVTPYTGIGAFQDILTRLLEGYRLEKPRYSDEKIYKIMLDCWRAEPSSRPVFSNLVNVVGNLLEDDVRQYYFQINEEYETQNVKQPEEDEDDYLVPKPVQSQVVRYVNVHARQSTTVF